MARAHLIRGGAGRWAAASSSTVRRPYSEAALFVGVWVLLGFGLRLGSDAYLLLGVPLTVAFQIGVRRRPLRELWVRGAPHFSLDGRGWLWAGALALAPAWHVARSLQEGAWISTGWWSCGVIGAGLAAFAVRSSTVGAVLRSALRPTLIGTVGMAVFYGSAHIVAGSSLDPLVLIGTIATYVAFYFPVTFVLEEVTFRGCLDTHVDRGSNERGSALFVSALWGLWHLPVAGGLPLPLLVLELLAWHILVGMPLSRAWRRGGNLAAPALAHATIDAVRNAFMVGLG
ncbi:MAG: CPBP family intramembrane metalloprotease [Nocardioidaceae bacterium]|nr:CPBP family intramembrane metalloprotease [Nocardioidaceae bacterium]